MNVHFPAAVPHNEAKALPAADRARINRAFVVRRKLREALKES